MTLHAPRDYQQALETEIYQAWQNGARNVCAVLPTGGGKTFVFSRIISAVRGAALAIAHRSELVVQMSVALGREGVRHRVIGPIELQREVTAAHMDEFQRSYFDPNAATAVASVDTLVQSDPKDPRWAQIALWVQDECHHVLQNNKWGRACALFPHAYGLGVTATPTRADGKGLGRDSDGVMDALVVGPTMRDLINRGYLTDYRIFAPPNDLDLSKVTVTDSGDFSPPKLKAARQQSHITGDVVQHYLRIARGKLGVTFETDVESAASTAAAFRAAGVPAEVVSSKTPGAVRRSILRRFRNREVLQLVNVDLFGEGFDLPAIEVVSMVRPTQSYGLFCQQFGRALRPMQGKQHAIILDHVGNTRRHGLPDAPRGWTLDRAERRSRTTPADVIPVRTCLNETCLAVYERIYKVCPYCGHYSPPAQRSTPEHVDGDLTELDASVLARLRNEKTRIDGDVEYPVASSTEVRTAIYRTHQARQEQQRNLRHVISLWAGWQRHLNRGESETYRRFYHRFQTDVASAQTLGAREAAALAERIAEELRRNNVVEQT